MRKEQIDIIKQLFSYYEIKSSLDNGQIFQKVINELSDIFNLPFNFIFLEPQVLYQIEVNKGITLIDNLAYEEEFKFIVNKILIKYNYYMKTFIKDAIRNLGNLKDPNKNKDLIKRLLKCLVIDDVTFDGKNKFTITSEEYGNYTFYIATEIFQEDWLKEYIQKSKHKNNCHNNTIELLNRFPEWHAICSQCKNYFINHYYHSYSFNPTSKKVIDLCSNLIMDKNLYDKLYEPIEIINMSNTDIKIFFKTKLPSIISSLKMNDLLKLALYYQYQALDKNQPEKEKVLNYRLPEEIAKIIK